MLALALCAPLTSCDTFKNMSDGLGDRAGSMRFWKKDKEGGEKKKRFWKKDKDSDEYTLAGGALPDPTEEQKLVEATERAANQGNNLLSESPDRIDLNRPVGTLDAPTIDIPQPGTEGAPDRMATAPQYEASSRTDPPVRPSFNNPVPRTPAPEVPLPTPANSGSSGGATNPGIPAPREKEKDEYIRLLPEPRFPGRENIVPPGD